MDNFDENGGWDFDNLDANQEFELVIYEVVAADYIVVVDVGYIEVVDYIVLDIAGNVILAVPLILVVVDVLLAPDDDLYSFQYDDKLHICIIEIEIKKRN